VLYALAPLLGLDIGGDDTDDLDALFLAEDGDGTFSPFTDLLALNRSHPVPARSARYRLLSPTQTLTCNSRSRLHGAPRRALRS